MSETDILHEHGNPWARADDPWTSKEAGIDGFPLLRDRCLVIIWLYFPGPFTSEDVGRLCNGAELRAVFNTGRPLGVSYWHRITDCHAFGWLEWVVDDENHMVARKEATGRSQGLRQITDLGREKAEELWDAWKAAGDE